MNNSAKTLADDVAQRFDNVVVRIPSRVDEVTFEAPADRLIEVATALRDEEPFRFEQLMDVCGVDYLAYGKAEWKTVDATDTGYSRGVDRTPWSDDEAPRSQRFAVVYHLLSIRHNQRLRLRTFCPAENPPIIDSVTGVWASANWFEREVFDLYGVLFNGHPDLRRLLTDYGFIGHPFRKDFPLSGHVEVRYDPEKGRVIYQPVTIEPRTLVPKTIRQDSRYEEAFRDIEDSA